MILNTPPSIHIEWANHMLSKIDLSSHETILELGCRQGKISAHLAQAYSRQKFTAIDNVESEIEQASEFRFPNLQFILQDARNLVFDEQFDAVVSFNNCLMWIKEKQNVLKNIHAVLKPGGKAYLQFFVRHERPKNDRFLSHTAAEVEWRSYFKGFAYDYYDITTPNFCQCLHQQGLIIHKLELMKYPTHFAHRDLLQKFFKSWASQIKYLPTAKQDHFFNEATKSYMDYHHYSPHDPFDYFEYVLEVICEKPLTIEEHNDPAYFQYGSIEFSRREAQVLKHFLNGKSAKEIGLLLALSPKTVEFHLASIKEKCQCYKRSDLFDSAISQGFISLMFDGKL